jgi:hypothetical protein
MDDIGEGTSSGGSTNWSPDGGDSLESLRFRTKGGVEAVFLLRIDVGGSEEARRGAEDIDTWALGETLVEGSQVEGQTVIGGWS